MCNFLMDNDVIFLCVFCSFICLWKSVFRPSAFNNLSISSIVISLSNYLFSCIQGKITCFAKMPSQSVGFLFLLLIIPLLLILHILMLPISLLFYCHLCFGVSSKKVLTQILTIVCGDILYLCFNK